MPEQLPSVTIPDEFREIATICTATEVVIGGKTVLGIADARHLHAGLKVSTRFNDWIARRIQQYTHFEQDSDFALSSPSGERVDFTATQRRVTDFSRGYNKALTYTISLDMAKELAMIERTDIGRLARRYFIWAEGMLQRIVQTLGIDPARLLGYLQAIEQQNQRIVAENSLIATDLAVIKAALPALLAKVDTLSAQRTDAMERFAAHVHAKQQPENELIKNGLRVIREDQASMQSASRRQHAGATKGIIDRRIKQTEDLIGRGTSSVHGHLDDFVHSTAKVLLQDRWLVATPIKRGESNRVSARLREYFRLHGYEGGIGKDRNNQRFTFLPVYADEWLEAEGRAMIAAMRPDWHYEKPAPPVPEAGVQQPLPLFRVVENN